MTTNPTSNEAKLNAKVLADEKFIRYRKRFTMITNSVTGAILLQRMIELWEYFQHKPFYRFKEAPKGNRTAGMYKEGESWLDDLGFNRSEFEAGLKAIATKVTKGVSKKDLLNADLPPRAADESLEDYCKRLKEVVSRLVIYWTDSRRVTWYQVNVELLYKVTSLLYIDNGTNLRYMLKLHTGIILKSRKRAVHDSSLESDSSVESVDVQQTKREEEEDSARARDAQPADESSSSSLPSGGTSQSLSEPEPAPIQEKTTGEAAHAEPIPPISAAPPLPAPTFSDGGASPEELRGFGFLPESKRLKAEQDAKAYRELMAHPLYVAFLDAYRAALSGSGLSAEDVEARLPEMLPIWGIANLNLAKRYADMKATPEHIKTIMAGKFEIGRYDYEFRYLLEDISKLLRAEAMARSESVSNPSGVSYASGAAPKPVTTGEALKPPPPPTRTMLKGGV